MGYPHILIFPYARVLWGGGEKLDVVGDFGMRNIVPLVRIFKNWTTVLELCGIWNISA